MENGPVGTTIRSAADMARSGNASDWQHRLAAQRQEDERLAREPRRQERDREKARQEELLESQQRAAPEQTAAAQGPGTGPAEDRPGAVPSPPNTCARLQPTP